MNRITGMHFDIMIGDLLVHVEEASLSIEDTTTVNKTSGVPDGVLMGSVSAKGSLKLDTNNFNKVIEVAKNAGSFRRLPTFDLNFSADTGDEKINVAAFGCKFRITELLNLKPEGSDKHIMTLEFDVTSKEFVHINNVSYLDSSEIRDIT